MSSREPEFHPDPQLLSAYASGLTPWAVSLCVRVHLETCATCRTRLEAREREDARFVDSLPEAPMEPARLETLIARLQAIEPETAKPPLQTTLGDVPLPAALGHVRLAKRRWLKPGLWVAPVLEGREEGWRIFVLRAPAGQRLPSHGHSGPEFVCVMTGAFEDGQLYRAGDFVETGSRTRHSLAVSDDGPCACLIATKGPLKWSGIATLLNPALSL